MKSKHVAHDVVIDAKDLVCIAKELVKCLRNASEILCHTNTDGTWEGCCNHLHKDAGTCDATEWECPIDKWNGTLKKAKNMGLMEQ